jgi:hypothetical protein
MRLKTRKARSRVGLADSEAKNLENPWIAVRPNFMTEKSLSYQLRCRATNKLSPNISKFFFGRFEQFQWLEAKKIWASAPSKSLSHVLLLIVAPTSPEVVYYKRGRAWEEGFVCSIPSNLLMGRP